MNHILPSSVGSCNQITRAVEDVEVPYGGIHPKCDWGHTRCPPAGVCRRDIDGKRTMTLLAHVDYLLPGGIKSVGHQDRKESDSLFAVTMWSVVGVTLTVSTIWLDFNWPTEPLIGLG